MKELQLKIYKRILSWSFSQEMFCIVLKIISSLRSSTKLLQVDFALLFMM